MHKPYKFISKNPLLSILVIASFIVLSIPFIYGILIATCIVIPIYFINKLFGNK